VCAATPKPGADVVLGDAANPWMAIGRKGSGRVIYLAWDPSLPPFRGWDGASEFWKSLLTEPFGMGTSQVIASISQTEERSENPYGVYANAGGSRLADAPFSISQLDIPAFYVVADGLKRKKKPDAAHAPAPAHEHAE